MDIRFTTPETIAKYIANDIESFLVVEFPTYEYANDIGTGILGSITANQNRFDVWIEGMEDAGNTPIGTLVLGDSTATPKTPAKIVLRGMNLFTGDQEYRL